jgi:hypothetical protein
LIVSKSSLTFPSFFTSEFIAIMKFSVLAILSTLAVASAFAPVANMQKASVVMNAEPEQSRKAFLSAAGMAMFGAVVAPGIAGAMDQDNVSAPTEQWETGTPTPAAEASRKERYTNARTQMTSNFPPIKRLNLERKSPVTRLDINAPDFTAYKKSYPGLFK